MEVVRVDKPWGYEEIWAKTDQYVGKILFIRAGHRLSLQYHERKVETMRVLSGILSMVVGTEERRMGPGEVQHVPRGLVHRMMAREGDVMVVEVSTPELDDVVRVEDDYRRN